ncbi:MAG: hypothetical protein CM15mV60_260 [uncultured marine virus]|nr:MAG: hypothetical protein CM15mV60_260 [uncultured marine virus]
MKINLVEEEQVINGKKITVVFTRPGKEYRQQDADSLVRDLDGLIEKLNSTFQQDLKKRNSKIYLVYE